MASAIIYAGNRTWPEGFGTPVAPALTVKISGTAVSVSWNPVDDATGYIIFYAPYPYTGPDSIGSAVIGNQIGISVDLWEGAAFYVAVRAFNSLGNSDYSNIEHFVIATPTTHPTVTTGAATSVAAGSATLNGIVNPNGSTTTYHFEYGVSSNYGSATMSTGIGSGADDVMASAAISGLSANTTYHYRFVAANREGTAYGNDQTFSTTVSSLSGRPVPDTGQRRSYTSTYGEDSDYIINPPSYTKLDADGNTLSDSATSWVMVRDNVTGLIWEVKTDDGALHDRDNKYTWYDAEDVFIAELNSSGFGGYSDWRLPTIKELTTIVDLEHYNPATDPAYFPNTAWFIYWSSTSPALASIRVWFVYFYDGSDSCICFKSDSYHVRAVRGGQGISTDYIVDNGDGTVTDTSTGLMWRQATAAGTMTWEEALSYCEDLSFAEYTDWRLPNRKELSSIVDFRTSYPAINADWFPDTASSKYWSSTTYSYANANINAWLINFSEGNNYYIYKSSSNYVRAVRGGQNRLAGHWVISTPVQASSWQVGQLMTIRWLSQSIGENIKISISRHGGKKGTYKTIAENIENNGAYTWTVSGPASINCMLKIELLSDPSKGTVQGLFTIL